MSQTIIVNKSLSEEEIYKSLLLQLEHLISESEPIISNLSNLSAALKESFEKISWVGFYLIKNNKLYLGPFQGKVACTQIEIGKGVCGTAVSKMETIIVDDIDKFPGHIACDAGSKSEIVIPMIQNGKIFGVLDLDSYCYSSFNEIDKFYLERICNLLMSKCDFEKLTSLMI